MPKLKNQRHEAFAQAIVSGSSQTEAYLKAGYSPNSADANATRLRGKESVEARIAELNGKLERKTLATAQEVQQFWTDVMRGLTLETRIFGKEAIRFDDLPPQISDRLRASESLAKALGIYGADDDGATRAAEAIGALTGAIAEARAKRDAEGAGDDEASEG